jgi:uncharacterized membrane protein YeaQ/YmgE (transglycosylase-associated protein family)
MSFILWIIIGGILGWLASLVMGTMRTNAQQSFLLNIIVGSTGSFLGGVIFSLIPGTNVTINQGDFSLTSLLVSFVSALVLLGIVNLLTRSRVR